MIYEKATPIIIKSTMVAVLLSSLIKFAIVMFKVVLLGLFGNY